MTYAAILNTFSSYERQFGATTFAVKGQATVKGHDAIDFDDLFSTGQSGMDASAYVVAPLTYLMANDREKVQIDGLTLTIASSEQPRRRRSSGCGWTIPGPVPVAPFRSSAAADISGDRGGQDHPD
jgi:hypothetical protein